MMLGGEPHEPREAKASDAAARPSLGDVFEAEFGYVFNSLRRLGVQQDDLQDQTQEVFLTLHRILDDYDPARPLRPWLFGVAYRVAARYRGRAHRKREVYAPTDSDPLQKIADATPGADVQLERERRRAVVLAAIEHLDFARRAVFVMSEIDGHPMPEIAAALGIPLNTAYSRLRIARDEFAVAIKRLTLIGTRS